MRWMLWAGMLLAWAGGALGAGAGWALREEVPTADGEEGGRVMYFAFGPHQYGFSPLPGSGWKTREVRLMGEEGSADVKVVAPAGRTWEMSRVGEGGGGNWLVWAAVDGQGKRYWQWARKAPFELGVELPDRTEGEGAGPGCRVAGRRVEFFPEPPGGVRADFPASTKLAAGEEAWFEVAWPEHVAAVDDFVRRARECLTDAGGEEASRKAAALAGRLLDLPAQVVEPERWAGAWRVRSIQGQAGFHVVYPFFRAEIRREGGRWVFAKTTGSQRRSGWLLPDGPRRWVFLGGATVNEEPARVYSRRGGGDNGGGPAEHDTVGVVFQTGPGRLVMVLDVREGWSYEIYELEAAKR